MAATRQRYREVSALPHNTSGSAIFGFASSNGASIGRNQMAHSSGDHCAQITAYTNGHAASMPSRHFSPLRSMPHASNPVDTAMKMPPTTASGSQANGRARNAAGSG